MLVSIDKGHWISSIVAVHSHNAPVNLPGYIRVLVHHTPQENADAAHNAESRDFILEDQNWHADCHDNAYVTQNLQLRYRGKEGENNIKKKLLKQIKIWSL